MTKTTEVRFYHLQKQTLDQALPLILEKAINLKKNIAVCFKDNKEAERFNGVLWSYKSNSFMPHGCKKDKNAEKQPIWLTDKDENPNNAKILILTQSSKAENISKYDLCCEILDGHSDEQVANARKQWKIYKENGFDITYWLQSENGGWEKKN